jgi:predicted transcriptional regulator
MCACSRVRGRSLTILRALTEHGPLRFSGIQHGLELGKDLTKIYLRRLRNYELVEKEINGWRITEKGAEKLDEVDRFRKLKEHYTNYQIGEQTGGQIRRYLLSCTPNCSLDRSPNCSPTYHYNTEHNKTNLTPKSPVPNDKVPRRSPYTFDSPKEVHAHTFGGPSLKIRGQLSSIEKAISERYPVGSKVSKKLLVEVALGVIPHVDRRTARSRIDKLISTGFLRQAEELSPDLLRQGDKVLLEIVGRDGPQRSEAEEPVDVRRKDHSSGLPGLQGA